MTAIHSSAVLVIDDDPDFRDLVRLFLEGEGVEVLEAPDCIEAAAILRDARDRIAVVLLDYWMPRMQPPQCSACVRQLVRPSTRVILVTAAVDARKRAIELGLFEWLSKPFDFEVLRRLVRESLPPPAQLPTS